MFSGGKLAALLIAQLLMCGLWAIGAWFYFHKQPIEACEARGAALRKEASALSAREELRAAEVSILRGDYAAALEHLPRARVHARQAGYALDLDFDDVDQMLCGEDQMARERLALLASRLLQTSDLRRGAAPVCPPQSPRVAVARSGSPRAAESPSPSPAPAPAAEKAGAKEPAAAAAPSEARDEDEGGDRRERRRRHRSSKSKGKERPAGRHRKGAPSAAASADGEAPAMASAKSQVMNALLRRQREVRACVKGRAAGRAGVTIRLAVSGAGQLTSKQVDTSLPSGEGEPVRSCVDGVLRSIRFPSVPVPEVRVVQSWTWRLTG